MNLSVTIKVHMRIVGLKGYVAFHETSALQLIHIHKQSRKNKTRKIQMKPENICKNTNNRRTENYSTDTRGITNFF